MSDFRNNNGLIEGKIPAGKSCPFYNNCNTSVDKILRCPSTNKPFTKAYSCGLARGFSISIEANKND